MLWLSLLFPHLALEVHTRGMVEERPTVISDGHGSRRWVHDCNQGARDCGIRPGMGLGAAHALHGDLRLHSRDPLLEEEALIHLADWGAQFTPHLTLHPPCGLLLEIGGSLALFHGLPSLLERVCRGLGELGYTVRHAVAPTPLAAWLFSRAGDGLVALEKGEMRRRLAELPVDLLELERLEALKGLGLKRIGQCLRLPRAGLSRRLGPEAVAYLLRALGDLPDPRPAYLPASTFRSRIALPSEVESTEALLFAARRLLLELVGFLQARCAGVQQLILELHHERRPPSRIELGLLTPTSDLKHLSGLLKVRLDHFTLPAPVGELSLQADQFHPLAGRTGDLFTHHEEAGDGLRLVESLRARLGREAVEGIAVVADHRPEYAVSLVEPGRKGAQVPPLPRPLWLLAPPVPLAEESGHPHLCAPLALLAGPERIESGWWEGNGVLRDYYVARDGEQRRLWIYRELGGEKRWFLQGIFG